MQFREGGRVVVQGPTKVRSRGLAALVVLVALVASLASTSWAAPGVPILVKDNPGVDEGAPTSNGAWFGWAQARKGKSEFDFYVQRGTGARVKVNAAKTQGFGGGIVGHSVYYVQKYLDRVPRIIRFDLKTGQRTPLPAKVNHYRHTAHLPCCGGQPDKEPVISGVRGTASVSGPWLLYSGYMAARDRDVLFYTVMLYNRVTHQRRTIALLNSDEAVLHAGQVNGNYATYKSEQRYGGSDFYRYNIKTKRSVELSGPDDDVVYQYDPAVSSDGTVYYFQGYDDDSGGPDITELVRRPIGGPAEVVTTLTTAQSSYFPPQSTFVKDRPDGSRVVFFSWKHGIYKIVDVPPTA